MSYARKHAATAAVIWTLILAGLVASVLIPGAARYTDADRSFWRLLTAVVILPGFLLHAWLGWRDRQGRRRGDLDERDDAVARRASEVTLMVVAILVFVAAIALYETHLDSGLVPAGWMYLLAYGTVAVVSLVHAVATLVVDRSGAIDG